MHAREKIVYPLDTPRLTAATVGVSRKMGDVLNRASAQWDPRLLASLYASAALEADDAHGAEHDVITKHIRVNRADLVAVIELAASAIDGRHAVPGELHQDCSACQAVLALGRVRSAMEWRGAAASQRPPQSG